MNIYNNVIGYILPLLEPWLTFFRTTFVLFLREGISHLDIKFYDGNQLGDKIAWGLMEGS